MYLVAMPKSRRLLGFIRVFHLVAFLTWRIQPVTAFRKDCPANAMARYRMELRGTWTDSFFNSRMLPKNFPLSWSWSTGIGVSLDAREDPYYNETVRTKLFHFVKKGGLSHTVTELTRPGSGVLDTFLIPSFSSTNGESSTVFFVDTNHSRVSFVSRMNHKPHWMLAVDSVNLCDNGQFRDNYELDLFPSENKPRHTVPVSGPIESLRPSQYGSSQPRESPGGGAIPNRGPTAGNGQTLVAPKIYRSNPEPSKSQATTRLSLVSPASYGKIIAQTEPTYLYSNEIDHDSLQRGQKLGLFKEAMPYKSPYNKPATPDPILAVLEPYQSSYSERSTHVTKKASKKKFSDVHSTAVTFSSKTSKHHNFSLVENTPVDSKRREIRAAALYGRYRSASTHRQNLARRRSHHQSDFRGYQAERYHNQPQNSRYRGSTPPSEPVEEQVPEVLPRLATVRFVKIATYHLSYLPPSGSRRKPRMGAPTPLPISIDKPMFNSMHRYLPHNGAGWADPKISGSLPYQQQVGNRYGYGASADVPAPFDYNHLHSVYPKNYRAVPLQRRAY